MLLLIDNYDSFVYNLGRYFGRLGHKRRIIRNDSITLREIEMMAPKAIILSPGPCTPKEAGICMPLIEEFCDRIPILGICLGHQCIGNVFGGRVVQAPRPVHGKASLIDHDGSGIFSGLPQRFKAGRYHSLIVDLPAKAPGSVPIRVSAQASDDGTIMAVQHENFPVFGLQFHPESVLTEHGPALLKNFMDIADRWNAKAERQIA